MDNHLTQACQVLNEIESTTQSIAAVEHKLGIPLSTVSAADLWYCGVFRCSLCQFWMDTSYARWSGDLFCEACIEIYGRLPGGGNLIEPLDEEE